MASVHKEPFLIQFEEQERRFSPKRRVKEEEPEDDNDLIDFETKEKIPRVASELDVLPIVGSVNSAFTKGPSVSSSLLKSSFEHPSIYAPPVTHLNPDGSLPTDRSARNIAYLCARVAEELKKRPQTRDELSNTTGFARQRICTVISVFKAIGLVNIRDSNTRRSEIEWNEDQAKLLPHIGTYVTKLLSLRAANKQLRAKEQELIQKLVDRSKGASSSTAPPSSTTADTSQSTDSNVGNVDPNVFDFGKKI